MFLYESFSSLGKDWKGLPDTDFKSIYKFLRKHAFGKNMYNSQTLESINKKKINQLRMEVCKDEERANDPIKYAVLDYIYTMYEYDRSQIEEVFINKFLKEILSNATAFRAARLRLATERYTNHALYSIGHNIPGG